MSLQQWNLIFFWNYIDDLKWQQRWITASLPRILWTKGYKRQHLLLEPGPSHWWGAYTLVDALFSQLSILSAHLFEDYFPLCPSPISHFSLAIQKEFIRLLGLHPGLSQHHPPLPLFSIFSLLSIRSAFQLKQLKNTHPSPPTFSISMEFLALTFYFKPLFSHSELFHHIGFPLPLR